MAKDRARPFSRKHRKYWLTVTGGMVVIGLINVAVGFWAYEPGPDTVERIEVNVPNASRLPEGALHLRDVPPDVMRGFNKAVPRHAPRYARQLEKDVFEVTYVEGTGTKSVRIMRDGSPAPLP